MATLAENNVYFELDGTDLSAYFTDEVTREVSVNQIDVTAGAGADWVMNSPGLKSYSLTLRLVYDTSTFQTVVQPKLNTGIAGAVMKYGPEGNTAGKPKDELKVNIESVRGPNVTIQKDKVMVEINLTNGNAQPVAIIETGGTF